jgi:hypothetical protein
MPEPHEPNADDKAEGKEKKPKKPLEYRRFERLLKQAIKAPPLRRAGGTKRPSDQQDNQDP